MSKKHDQPSPDRDTTEQHNPALADLLREKGFAESPAPPPPPAQPAASAKADDISALLARAGKIVLRREKKGHGGKTVTTVSGLDFPAPTLDTLAKALRKGLGCGSMLDGKTIVLQGDIQQRAEEWLRGHGATKIVRGN